MNRLLTVFTALAIASPGRRDLGAVLEGLIGNLLEHAR